MESCCDHATLGHLCCARYSADSCSRANPACTPQPRRLSENRKRAKYYSLTRAGKKRLDYEQREWARLSAAISMALKPT
jgi:hypothetical protein